MFGLLELSGYKQLPAETIKGTDGSRGVKTQNSGPHKASNIEPIYFRVFFRFRGFPKILVTFPFFKNTVDKTDQNLFAFIIWIIMFFSSYRD